MCGIAGALSARDDRRTGTIAVRLATGLAHRGPDGEGFWSLASTGEQRVGKAAVGDAPALISLGHRRLSIVDLHTGAQPMTNEAGDVWVSFNGEIYNHRELRKELERLGHRFRTESDTEVFILGWRAWGAELFGRLNGIFAASLVDVRERSLFLVRDPLGVKPLYVGASDGLTWWASEISAAVEAGVVSPNVNADAVRLFLTFRFVPSPYGIYHSVWKVPPGHFVQLTPTDAGQSPQFTAYRSRIASSSRPAGKAEWSEAIAEGLRCAVRRQLMSDVPVGTLLSGGVDSTVISTLMTEQLPTAPQAFGIGVTDEDIVDESQLAARVAREIKVPFVGVTVSRAEFTQSWPLALTALGEPLANPGMMLVGRLCEVVGASHKVVLTGQGADEPLGGYPRHMAERLWRLGRFAPALSAIAAQRLMGGEAGLRLARVLRSRNDLDRFVEILTVIPSETVDRVVIGGSASAKELAREAVRRWFSESDDSDSLNALLRIDARLSLADDLLVVADLFSMRSSVELRVPFLDLEFVELMERMPSRFKLSNFGSRKWLYRQTVRRLLPRDTADRLCGIRARLGRKQGFSTPTDAWPAHLPTPQHNVQIRREPVAEVVDWKVATADVALHRPRQRNALLSLAVWAGGAELPSLA